jgi:DNA-3-methyladenine glycosylase
VPDGGPSRSPRAGAQRGTRHRPRRLRRAELPFEAIDLARFLVGKLLVRREGSDVTSGRIVEAEAYTQEDPAAHTYRGETARNRSMFLERGHAYVYFTYGCWHAINVSAAVRGVGAGVLLRALVPHHGIATMQARRGVTRLIDLARGPGRLATAMAIDRRLDGTDLCAPGPLWLADDGSAPPPVGVTTRIGLSKEAHRPLRFYSREPADLPFVSGPRRLLAPEVAPPHRAGVSRPSMVK